MIKDPKGIKSLLVILIALILLFVAGVVWWAHRESNEQNSLASDVEELTFALGAAHEENPEEVPAPEDVISDPPDVIKGDDGRDGRDGRDGEDGQDGSTPTPEEIALATEAWLNQNISDQPDPDDPETQNDEIQDPEINDPDPNDPDFNDPELQDDEIQDAEVQDPEIDDPDPGVESFRFVFDFANKTYNVLCTDADKDLQYTCVAVETEQGGA